MTPQPQPSCAVNCRGCGRYLQVGNPRPREVPARVLVNDFGWIQCSPQISQEVWINCAGCGRQVDVLFIYASEEVIQELNIGPVPPF